MPGDGMHATIEAQWEQQIDRYLSNSMKGAPHMLEQYTISHLLRLKAPDSYTLHNYRIKKSKQWDDQLQKMIVRGRNLVANAVGVPAQKVEKTEDRMQQLQALRNKQERWRQAQSDEAGTRRAGITRDEAMDIFRSGARQHAEDGWAKYGAIFGEEVEVVARKRKLEKIVHVVPVAKEPALEYAVGGVKGTTTKMEGDRPTRPPTPRPAPSAGMKQFPKAPFHWIGRQR